MIKTHTDFEVELYCGAKGVDQWTANRWKQQVSKYQVSADPGSLVPFVLYGICSDIAFLHSSARYIILDYIGCVFHVLSTCIERP